MCVAHTEIVNMFNWYQCPTDRENREVRLSEEFLKYHRLDNIYLSYCLENEYLGQCAQAFLIKKQEAIAKFSSYRSIATELSSRLKEANVCHVFLKGIVLAENIYTEPWHRYFSDLDLLVDKQNLSIVEGVLKKMGYQFGVYLRDKGRIYHPTRAEVLFQKTYTHEMYNMVKMETDTLESNIDINFLFEWRGISSNKTYSVSDLHDHIEIKRGIPVFNNAANLIHLCCHLYNEAHYFSLDRGYKGGDPREILLIRVFDIGLLAKHLSNRDFITMVFLAKQLACVDKVAYSISLANLLLNKAFGNGLDELSVDSEDIFDGYYGKDQQYKKWPITIYDRIFDLQKKREVSNMLFSTHED